jgi:hypothetical protein
MVVRRILKILFGLGFVLCSLVVGIMYNKLSFIDWPYVLGGVFFLLIALLISVKK